MTDVFVQPKPKLKAKLELKEDKAVDPLKFRTKVENNLRELNSYVQQDQLQTRDKLNDALKQLDLAELKVLGEYALATKACAESKEELPRQSILGELQTISKNRAYVKASKDFLASGFDKTLLQNRIKQMDDLYSAVKLKDKNERSQWDAYNSVFDLSSTTAKTLKKNNCEKCDHPLTANKKHALLQCSQCARSTEQLIPLTSPHHMNQSSAQTLTARMAAMGGQKINPQDAKRSKAVHVKLQQFRVGQAPIPPELLIQVKDRLRKKEHINAAFVALPTPVGDALKYLKQEQYLPFKDKMANMINGVVIEELTDAQINEITARLKVVQMMFRFLRNDVQDHIYINFFVNRICNMLGWKNLASLFPTQRTSSTLKAHMDMWRTLISFLQCFDSNFQWHEGY
jgi:hypothetical protein